MAARDNALDALERQLRRGLAGVPRPDVDDIVEETRSHLAEETAEGRTPEEAVAAFGDPDTFSAEIIERRLSPDGSEVAGASRGRRLAALCADFVFGWGPLVVFPIWMVLIAFVVDRFLMGPEEIAWLQSQGFYQRAGLPLWATLGTIAVIAWGVFYWNVLRARSVSPGMRMAGVSRVSVGGKRVTVRSDDLAESVPARIVAKPKWFLAVPVGLFGLVVLFAGFYYTTFAVGSVMQPWDSVKQSVDARTDLTRAEPVLKAFYQKVLSGDVAGAQSLATTETASAVADLSARASADNVARADLGQSVGVSSWEMQEYIPDKPSRTVVLTLKREEIRQSASTFVTVYKVSGIDMNPAAQ